MKAKNRWPLRTEFQLYTRFPDRMLNSVMFTALVYQHMTYVYLPLTFVKNKEKYLSWSNGKRFFRMKISFDCHGQIRFVLWRIWTFREHDKNV